MKTYLRMHSIRNFPRPCSGRRYFHRGICARGRASQSCDTEPVSPVNRLADDTENENIPHSSSSSNPSGRRMAILQAKKSAIVPVDELDKPLDAYMTLPASQYSVLDAKRIERLDSDTFRCYVGGLHFLNFHVEPVLTLSVTVGKCGPTVRLLQTELQGSKAALEANKKFTATMTNEVCWEYRDDGSGGKQICSSTSIQVTLEVPGWFVLPVSIIERSGCAVMQQILNTAVPRFLEQLKTDYAVWANGDESRNPVGDLM